LIQSLNRWADVTVYQSEFVRRTAQPVLQAARHVMILNGGNTALFHPGPRPGTDIGHVTWGVIPKKRLDRVHEEILRRPAERFRLVGRHAHADLPGVDFRLPNVLLRGERNRRQMPSEFRQMKVLFFPSENDPCPNTVVEAILCGVPVCYHPSGGTPDIVGDCGETLDQFDRLLANLETYRARCLRRQDLHFNEMMSRYQELWRERPGKA
jgi:glycosyltransferase involved in cell wall biosynthesis